ncbi:acyl-CoA synthetase (AMP-forming)/AMP-acid ligase II [Nocardioides sp. BE266]|uniref:AMP-binding protein n=1 Tax=Nocardioides sp. BE266 TaxID=2817725 RepID=UPI0028658A95|nr:AMP-binding protein [Nocardioides sp. BE266]MDR7254272.1 acyl-CoA synthetase (AMP-forming)/AMP-acid ligase II [Nocardioides sp. BE266]
MPDHEITLPQVEDFYSNEQVAEFRRRGFWRDETPSSQLEHWASTRGEEVFVQDPTGDLTFGDLRGQAWRLALSLRRLGVAAGDRVVVQLPNWPELLISMAAVTRIGGILVPAMMTYRIDELRHLVDNTGARLAIATGSYRGFDHAALLHDLVVEPGALETVVLARSDDGDHRLDAMSQPQLGVDAPGVDVLGLLPSADDGHVIIHTSGTESRPKGCFHTYNTIGFSVRAIERTHGWTRSDIAFGPTPVVHSNGYLNHFLVPLRVGASTALMERWDPGAAVRMIQDRGCTTTVTATTFLTTTVAAQSMNGGDLSSMRLWVASGTTVPAPSIEAARVAMPDCEILSQYGRSENQLTTNCPVGSPPEKSLTSDGQPPDGVTVALFDQDGARTDRGPGDVGYRGPGHMLGYLNQPDLTSSMLTADGFSLAGDLAEMDADGYIRITGRLKDIIIRGGVNISAREVEEHLLASPLVRDVAVVGMPDDRLGERACAFVVPEPGTAVTLAALTSFLEAERGISRQKLPERLEVVDALPLSAMGKVQKGELRARVSAGIEGIGA